MRRILLTLLLSLALPASAMAEGFSLTEWSARGVALTGGLVARSADASTVAYNPAGMSQLAGTHLMFGSAVINPHGRIKGDGFSAKADNKYWPLPHFYITHQLNDKFWVGVGVFTRFGLGNGYKPDWAGSRNVVNAKVESATLNPNIAWKMTDKFTAAVGVEFFGIQMKQKLNTLGTGNNQTLKAYGLNMAVNVGLHYAFNDQWALGFTWRSRINATVHGTSRWGNAARPTLMGMPDSDISGTMYLPDTLSLALAWKVNERLSLELGISDTLWSTYKNLNIQFENWGPSGTLLVNNKRWKDSYAFSLSAEYQALDWLTLRAGYSYETSPMNLDYADYMLPTNGRHRFGLGAGIKYENWTFDLAYAYFRIKSINYDRAAALSTSVLKGSRSSGVGAHGLAFSVGYSF